jgi:hypothetical protein
MIGGRKPFRLEAMNTLYFLTDFARCGVWCVGTSHRDHNNDRLRRKSNQPDDMWTEIGPGASRLSRLVTRLPFELIYMVNRDISL